jgi:hypothetical protein
MRRPAGKGHISAGTSAQGHPRRLAGHNLKPMPRLTVCFDGLPRAEKSRDHVNLEDEFGRWLAGFQPS